MAYLICDASGKVLIGSGSGASSANLFAGSRIESCSLALETRTIEAQAFEDAYPQEDVITRKYEVNVSILYDSTDTTGFFAAGIAQAASVYVSYLSQNASGTIMFAGLCIPASARDEQAGQNYQRQSITLRSTGAPDVG